MGREWSGGSFGPHSEGSGAIGYAIALANVMTDARYKRAVAFSLFARRLRRSGFKWEIHILESTPITKQSLPPTYLQALRFPL